MTAFSELQTRIKTDSSWRSNYHGNWRDCQRISSSIPLIHVTCKNGLLSDLIAASRGLLEVSARASSAGAATVRDEDAGQLQSALYFYAGRAYPVLGGLALVFSNHCERNHTGSSTPFDSGGMIRGYIHPFSSCQEATRAAFLQASALKLAVWRRRFRLFLAAYFKRPDHYLDGKPEYPDPEGIFLDRRNEFRAWTFEVRFHEAHSLKEDDVVCWYGQQRHLRSLERRALSAPLSEHSIVKDLRARGVGATDYIKEVEQWVRKAIFEGTSNPGTTTSQ